MVYNKYLSRSIIYTYNNKLLLNNDLNINLLSYIYSLIKCKDYKMAFYLCNYYNKQARNALRGIATSTVSGDNILSLKDGESSVTFVNRNEVSKVYRGLASDCMEKVTRLAAQYNIYQAQPRQLGGIDASGYATSYPNPY